MQIHSEGGMNNRDLQELIDRRIPDNRTELDKGHENLKNVADYCQNTYVNSNASFKEIKNKLLRLIFIPEPRTCS